jgi:predicted HicB family RNase H-like nuclease
MARPRLDDPTVPIAFRAKRSAAEKWTVEAQGEGMTLPKYLREVVEAEANARVWYVYRLWSSDDELLYIGCSIRPLIRLTQHAREKAWWSEVSSMTAERYGSVEEARQCELRAIATEAPRHNVASTPNRSSRRQQYREGAGHQVMVRLDTETFERALAEATAQEWSVSFIIRRALKDALERAEKSRADFESAQRAVNQVLQTSSDEATKALRSFAKATSLQQQRDAVEPRFKKGGK